MLVLRAIVGAGLAGGVLAACTLDWTVRADDTTSDDASTADVARDVATPHDAAGDDDDDVAPSDAAPDVAVDCNALTADAANKKKAAQACSFQIGECTDTVDDACGCEVAVSKSTASATTAYSAAVMNLEAHPECLACTTCPTRTTGACLQNATGTIACTP